MRKPRRRPRATPPSRRANPETTRRELLQAETGDLDTGGGAPRIALVYPNSYGVGMASLGYLVTRDRLRAFGAVERAFVSPANWHGAEETRSLETARSLASFDVLAFSVAYEMDYLQIARALAEAGLPLFASERGSPWPLVLAGGMALSVNAAGIYPFVDAIAYGRESETVEALGRAWQEQAGFRSDSARRAALLARLATARNLEITAGALRAAGVDAAGFETDGQTEKVSRFLFESERAMEKGAEEALRFLAENEEPDRAFQERRPLSVRAGESDTGDAAACSAQTPGPEPVPVSRVVTPHAELGRRVLVEIARGCANRCAFCWLGHHGGRFAPWEAGEILEACDRAAEATECESVGLISSAVGAHPEIEAICEGLLSRGRKISFSSLRAEELRPIMLEALARSGQRGLTLAPEAGDEYLRRALGKTLGDDGFLEAIDNAQNAGLEDLKLYFMIGLPGETDEQAGRIVDFTDRARRLMLDRGRARGRLGNLSVNLGIYVPKPGTPMARRNRPDLGATRRRSARVARALSALPNVRVAASSATLAAAQTILSTSGLRAAALVYETWRLQGDWKKALRNLT